MASNTNENVRICSRKQAIEIIPVAITSAKYPGNRSAAVRERSFEGGSVTHLLKQILRHSACSRAPMMFVVLVEVCDLLFHRSCSRPYPLLVLLREVGRHHLMIDKVMAKQIPDATTSGSKTEK